MEELEQKNLPTTDNEEEEIIKDSVATIMTPDFVKISKDHTVQDAFDLS